MTQTYRRDAITLLLIGLLAFYNAFLNILGPLMPYLRDELDLSYTIGSLHFSAIAAGMMTGGWLGDRAVRALGRSRAAWLGSVGICLGAGGLATGTTPIVTITSVFLLMGCVGSLVLIVIGSSLSDHHGHNRTLAIAEANIGASLGAGMGPLAIGAAVWAGFGWRGSLLLPVIFLALLGLRFRGTAFPEMKAITRDSAGSGPLPRAYWAYWATVTVVVGIEYGLIYFGADFLDEVAGLSRDSAATTMSLFLWGMLAGRIVGRQALNKINAAQVLPGALAITSLGFAIYWVFPSPIISVAGLFVAGLGVANLYPLASSLAFEAAPTQSNAAGARLSFASGSAILVAPLMLGALADLVGLRIGYLIVPLLIVAAIGFIRLGARLPRTGLDGEPAHAIALHGEGQ